MRVLVIPDIHLKPWIFDKAEDILKESGADKAVCLMDIPDDWGMEPHIDRYEEVFDRAIGFSKDHPETLWCYGNHDISYLWHKLETGYSPYAEATVRRKLKELEWGLPDYQQMAFVHRIGNVIFLHGGIIDRYISYLDKDLMDADIDDVIQAINDAAQSQLWIDISPLWYRPQYSSAAGFRSDRFTQVVGHTPVQEIHERNGFVSTDVFSTYQSGFQIGESKMIVIDTKTGRYKKYPV